MRVKGDVMIRHLRRFDERKETGGDQTVKQEKAVKTV